MAGKDLDFPCKLGYELDGIKIKNFLIYQAFKFQVFADTSGRFTHSLVVSDLRSETKVFQFDSGCYFCAEVSSLQ